MKGLSWIIALAGVWEIISPFILGFSTAMTGLWDNIIVGVILIILGVWAALSSNLNTARVLNWISAVVGVWMIISPFVLGTSAMAAVMWDEIVVGIIVLILGVWAALSTPRVTV